jgi:hypothetical protein
VTGAGEHLVQALFPSDSRRRAARGAQIKRALSASFCLRQASYLLDQAKGTSPHASLVVSRTTTRASLRHLDVLQRRPVVERLPDAQIKISLQTGLLGVEFMRELDLKCLRVDLDNRTLTPLEKIAQGGRSGLLSLSPGTTPCQLRAGAGRGRRQRLHFSECCRRHRERVLRWLSSSSAQETFSRR